MNRLMSSQQQIYNHHQQHNHHYQRHQQHDFGQLLSDSSVTEQSYALLAQRLAVATALAAESAAALLNAAQHIAR